MERGDILTLKIDDLARAGSGVAREPSGQVVFVPFTAPGDRIEARVLKIHKRFIEAELLKIIEPSPVRISPKCAVFTKCGGCQWQHLPYALQWETKTKGVKHALKRVGIESVTQWDLFPSEKNWEYRNRVQLRGFGNQLGFYAPESHQLVNLDRCEIARPEINEAIPSARKEAEKTRKEGLFKVEIEVDENNAVQTAWNSKHSAFGFRQVHEEQNEKLKHWIEKTFELTDQHGVLDLFGGNGNLSLNLASRVKEIHCVDLHARSLVKQDRFFFHKSLVVPWIKTAKLEVMPRVAIIDPPRDGIGEDIHEFHSSLLRLNVGQLILVGCDPDSWARDVYRLTNKGWKLERAAIFDFFPQTRHVESAALLRL
jgi:23S rRNA (uracil1939-C5)-methyltransferase